MKSEKGHLRKSHKHRDDLTGEYVFGDMGQLIFLVVFLVVWIADSFVFKYSTFLTQYISNYIRVPIALIVLIISGLLAGFGLNTVFGKNKRRTAGNYNRCIFYCTSSGIPRFNTALSWIHFIIAISPFGFGVDFNYSVLLYDLSI